MVKNTQGGNKHKNQARKYIVAKPSNKLRIAEDEGELYAVVTKMLGNGMFHAHCIDGIARLGHIRGKFTGRRKRDNIVAPGVWVLVGEREWDIGEEKASSTGSTKVKLPKCDLLEVYNESDKERLRDTVSENWNVLLANDQTKVVSSSTGEDDLLHFATEKDEEIEKLEKEMVLSTTKIGFTDSSSTKKSNIEELLIDFDDI
jgi:translation initiation factor 1A